ncbi:MAG TPA: prepilin-type N-terminal cleavage/methylation domain-containing protein, partial [Thermoanaerobaculia bacterium]|nr:prepilin-type N-terminal cleavage/methylation domain-containing protein [Thermoanaerobaculia bacterium]
GQGSCVGPAMWRTNRTSKSSRGFTIVEILTVMGILGLMFSIVILDAAKVLNRARAGAAISTVTQTFAAARLQAIKRGCQVVVEVSVEAPGNRISLRTFEDRSGDLKYGTYTVPPDTTPLPELILSDTALDTDFHIWKSGGAKDDLASGVLFGTYHGDTSLAYRVAFLPGDGIVPPEDSKAGLPTPQGGRGFYFADARGKNFFRLTIASNLVGVPVMEKWANATDGYVASDWSWQ